MKPWKDITQYTTAVAALTSGIALAFIQYFDMGDLTNGVLGYVAQVLVYAAGIFGVTMYWNGKYRESAALFNARYDELKREIRNDLDNTNKVSSSEE
jgi:hypothetical protein